MPISHEQRRDLLRAERTRDAATIRDALRKILRDNDAVTLLDCEMALRDAAAKTYLIAGSKDWVTICFSLVDAKAALERARINPGKNWALLTTAMRKIDSGTDRTA